MKNEIATWSPNLERHTKILFRQSILFIWFYLFIFSKIVTGQTPGLINYSIREGLPSTEVYEVFQDSHGFIWFATDHGVAKFDGYEMKILTIKDGLTDPVVFGFDEDDRQRIWFRTYSGKLSIYEKDKITPFEFNNRLEDLFKNNILYSLHFTEGKIYFGSEKYLGTIGFDGKIEKEEIKERELKIRLTQDKKLLYGFYGLSTRVKSIHINDQNYPITLTDTLVHNKVICGLQDGDRTLITINTDIFSYNGVQVEKVFTGQASIISLSKDKEGFYWVGYTNHGADQLTPDNFKIIDHPTALSIKSITKVMQDHESGMWFSTLEEGVFYSSNMKAITINKKDKTRCVTFNANYGVIGDQIGDISIYDLKNGTLVWKKNFSAPTRSLFIDNKNQLWVSTDQTTIVDLVSGKIKNKINASFTSYSTHSDSTLLAVGGSRISRFDLRGHSDYIISNSIHLQLLFDNSILYTSGRTGLEIFDSNMKLISKPKALSNSRITTIIPYDNKSIFIGTIGNGFHLINKKTFNVTSFNAGKNFIANDVYYMQKEDSLIWISTEKGLLALKLKSLNDNPIQYYRTISKEFQYERINFFHVTNQSIWVVSDYNIKIIPRKKEIDATNPLFYYTWIRPEGINTDQKIEIKNKGLLQLKFGFISFNNQNIYVRYRISQNNDWTEASSRIINLQSISAGNYLLDIEFSLDNSQWNKGASLPFTVLPEWWNTWYTRFAFGLIILLVGVVISRRRITRYKEKNNYLGLLNEQQKKLLNAEIEATERERSRIAKDLHDGIGMDLVSIKLMANQIAKNTEDQNALKIQSQLQKTISEIQNIIYGLTPSGLKLFGLSYGLENYIAMVSRNHPTMIKLDVQGKEIKDPQIGAIVYRVIQELITNSIKHSKCEKISINIKVFINAIQITYHDNGIGFNPENVKQGLGLSNIQSRVEALGGQLNFESGSMGTSYSINLPLKGDRQ